MANDNITPQRLREVLDYNPETGVFTWLVNRKGNGARIGKLATAKNKSGYGVIAIDHVRYRAHRLAWLYVHGSWPSNFVDHINGDRADNRIVNLREATNAENLQNMRKARRDSSHGFLGVTRHSVNDSWVAQICAAGKRFHLGSFKTVEEARAAYLGAKKVLHDFAPQEFYA